jgi:hypothetical protein
VFTPRVHGHGVFMPREHGLHVYRCNVTGGVRRLSNYVILVINIEAMAPSSNRHFTFVVQVFYRSLSTRRVEECLVHTLTELGVAFAERAYAEKTQGTLNKSKSYDNINSLIHGSVVDFFGSKRFEFYKKLRRVTKITRLHLCGNFAVSIKVTMKEMVSK